MNVPSISSNPAARAALLSGLVLLALLFGLAGGVLGVQIQMMLVIVLVPAALLVLSPRAAVALLVLMLPFNGSTLPFLPRLVQNAVILGVPTLFFARMVFRIAGGKSLPFDIPRELLFYILVMVIGAGIGFTHLGEIDPLLLVEISDVGRFGFKEYVIGFFIKQMMFVVMALMVAAVVFDDKRGEWIVGLAIVGALLFVLGMVLTLLVDGTIDQLGSSRTLFISMGMHSNTLGGWLVCAFAIALFARETVPSRRLKLLLLGAAFVLFVGVMLTASRGAFVGLLAVLAYYVYKFRRIGAGFAAALILVIGLMVAPTAVQERLLQGLDSRSLSTASLAAGDRLSSGRFDFWLQLAPEVLENPVLGNGLRSTMWSYHNRYGRAFRVSQPHSMFLGVALDSGLVGLICLFVFYRFCWRLFASLGTDPRVGAALKGAFLAGPAVLVSMLAYGITNGYLYPHGEQVHFWLLLGLALGYRKLLGVPPPVAKAATRAGRRSLHA